MFNDFKGHDSEVMKLIYFGTRLSENISRREPEGYLICLNVPVARTGMQEYLAEELGMDPLEERIIPVWRPEEEVFDPACMASFEGMPVTNDHPSFPEGVTAENIRYLQKGHAHNIRRGTGKESDLLLADLIITDPDLEDEILNGKREISCGYNYVLSEEGGRYIQREIRGNHVAVVEAGRAGPRVSIRDHKRKATRARDISGGEKTVSRSGLTRDVERSKKEMKKTVGSNAKDSQMRSAMPRVGHLSAGRMAKIMAKMARDGETQELAEVIAEIMEPEISPVDEIPVSTADPVIAGAVEEILEGDEEEAVPAAEEPVEVTVPENREITIDCGMEILELLRQIVTLLTPVADCNTQTASTDECASPENTEDADPADIAAEALAEAVTTAVEAATEEVMPVPDEDPVTALVAEAVEQAVTGTVTEAMEDPESVLLPGDTEEELAAMLIEPEKDEEIPQDKTADALRAAMVTFRPILKSMAPAARRKAVAKIASNLKARDRQRNAALKAGGVKNAGTMDTYARLKGASSHRAVTEPTGDLGRKIMEARNPHYRGKS